MAMSTVLFCVSGASIGRALVPRQNRFGVRAGNPHKAIKEHLMQRFKVMVLAALAVFALGATMVASAYGVEALNSKNEPTEVTFKGQSEKTTTLSTLANSLTVSCKKTTSEAALTASGQLGSFHISFEKCTTSLGGTCTGLGDPAETILAL